MIHHILYLLLYCKAVTAQLPKTFLESFGHSLRTHRNDVKKFDAVMCALCRSQFKSSREFIASESVIRNLYIDNYFTSDERSLIGQKKLLDASEKKRKCYLKRVLDLFICKCLSFFVKKVVPNDNQPVDESSEVECSESSISQNGNSDDSSYYGSSNEGKCNNIPNQPKIGSKRIAERNFRPIPADKRQNFTQMSKEDLIALGPFDIEDRESDDHLPLNAYLVEVDSRRLSSY